MCFDTVLGAETSCRARTALLTPITFHGDKVGQGVGWAYSIENVLVWACCQSHMYNLNNLLQNLYNLPMQWYQYCTEIISLHKQKQCFYSNNWVTIKGRFVWLSRIIPLLSPDQHWKKYPRFFSNHWHQSSCLPWGMTWQCWPVTTNTGIATVCGQ